jgi:anti-sigma regulatory factor (Ser/Thr protein kinase)
MPGKDVMIVKEQLIMEKRIEKGDFQSGGEASSKLKDLLRKLGVEPATARKTAIVTYELEMNIIIHSEGGNIKAFVNSKGITLQAEDDGPGIEDLEKAFQPGYSTASDEIRQLGFGAGMGLTNVKSYSSKLDINTGPEGTKVKAFIGF